MSHDFDFFCLRDLLTNALDVLLSVFNGVGGCECPGASNSQRMWIIVWPLRNSPLVCVSAADATIISSVLHSTSIGAFGAGFEMYHVASEVL